MRRVLDIMLYAIRNPAIQITIAALLTWFTADLFIDDRWMIEIPSAALIVACGGILYFWGKAGLRVYWAGAKRPEDSVILFACLLSICLIAQRAWGITGRAIGGANGMPAWMQQSSFVGFFIYGIVIALALAIYSTRIDGERMDRGKMIILGILAPIGLIISAFGHIIVTKIGPIISYLVHILPR